MTLTEKIIKLKSLGVAVFMKPTVDTISFRNDYYNQLGMHPGMTEEEVENGINEKLKFYETHPWITIINNLSNIPADGICQFCQNYNFVLAQDTDHGDYFLYTKLETCNTGHYFQVFEKRHNPITTCKNFNPAKS